MKKDTMKNHVLNFHGSGAWDNWMNHDWVNHYWEKHQFQEDWFTISKNFISSLPHSQSNGHKIHVDDLRLEIDADKQLK